MTILRDKEILLLYNLPAADALESEKGVLVERDTVAASLEKLKIPYKAIGVRDLYDITTVLADKQDHIIFNLVEGFAKKSESAAHVPAVCESFNCQATGGSTACLTLTLDKVKTKGVLSAASIPVPKGIKVRPGSLPEKSELFPGPYIVKPACTDASEGLFAESSVCKHYGKELLDAIKLIHKDFKQPAIVEQLVGTREFNVSVIEINGRISILPIAEISFAAFPEDMPRIVDYSAKWIESSFAYANTPRIFPDNLPETQKKRISTLAVKSWHALGCRDYARVDFRMDDFGNLYVLEVNSNPDISPDAGFAAALEKEGIAYHRFVDAMLQNAKKRLHADNPPKTVIPSSPEALLPPIAEDDVLVRHINPKDQQDILNILNATVIFRPTELVVAAEVLESSISNAIESEYFSLVAESAGQICGWICYGPTPCTSGVMDIYWIVASTKLRRRGIGRALMTAAEKEIRASGARLITIDTAGRDDYLPSRLFYQNAGYEEKARIRDFYTPGDDKVVFVKEL
ncbi:MAG: GNAT family N-acetyltransferase [Proteobacteria bacterium]|nr:GNAT family N-acetyltransferase [Pseudomonadota bacterium]MBU1708401.1 GNAT family N-acetyltransferase [Pseudomonadota bacterium]